MQIKDFPEIQANSSPKKKKQRSHQISFCIALWGFENRANVEGNSLYANLAKS
jgi:hypothetical protein